MDAVTAVSGSGPAYFYLLMEHMERAAIELGLSADLAAALTRETALGAARVVIETKAEPARTAGRRDLAGRHDRGGAAGLRGREPGRPSSGRRWRRPGTGRPSSAGHQRGSRTMQNALVFILRTLFDLYILTFALRLLLQWAAVDKRNPLVQFILRVTNPLVIPLRRLLPPIGRIDTATVVVLLGLQVRGHGAAGPHRLRRRTGDPGRSWRWPC